MVMEKNKIKIKLKRKRKNPLLPVPPNKTKVTEHRVEKRLERLNWVMFPMIVAVSSMVCFLK